MAVPALLPSPVESDDHLLFLAGIGPGEVARALLPGVFGCPVCAGGFAPEADKH